MIEGNQPLASLTQTDLAALHGSGRLGDQPLVIRTMRRQLGGGFGDSARHPYAWIVHVTMDGEVHRILSARGAERAWTNLDRLERWLREQGFRAWSVINDLEPCDLAEESGHAGAIPPREYNRPTGLK